jgi:hypothetical protein
VSSCLILVTRAVFLIYSIKSTYRPVVFGHHSEIPYAHLCTPESSHSGYDLYVWPFSQDLDGNGEISFDEVRRHPPAPATPSSMNLTCRVQFKPLWNLVMV